MLNFKLAGAFVAAAALATVGTSAQAAHIDWVMWINNTAGTLPGVTVTYSGELAGISLAPQYTPASSFTGGPVDNAPAATDDSIILRGGGGDAAVVDTVTFSQALLNPVFAIWSLGQGGGPADFNFISPASFTIVAGGPTVQYGGGPITASGPDVHGVEGNGVIQFNGLVSSISWTNPNHEDYYAFTVGAVAVPEPASWALMIAGFGLAGATLRARRKQAATA
jgi:hypothetical protein